MNDEEVQALVFVLLLTAAGLFLEAAVTVIRAWNFISHYLGV